MVTHMDNKEVLKNKATEEPKTLGEAGDDKE